MKVYIVSDLEGAACVFSRREGYINAAEYATMELSAVCEALYKAGVEEIIVNCLHILDYHKFPQRVRFIHAEPTPDIFTNCLDSSFYMVMVTGMHAMAGGLNKGCWRHTFLPPPISQAYSSIAEMRVNGQPIGETGLIALFAGIHQVPLGYLSGDLWACREAEALLPGVATLAVKTGLSFYSAISLHPAEAAERSAEAAVKALKAKNKVKPLQLKTPLTVEVEYTFEHRAADTLRLMKTARRVDEKTVMASFASAEEFRDAFGNLRAPEDELHQADLEISCVSGFMARTGVEPYEYHPGFVYPGQIDFAFKNWGK
jgi:D-amino peptidase